MYSVGRGLVAWILAGASGCASAASPQTRSPQIADAGEPAVSQVSASLPPARGEHLVIEQRPCPFACPAYRLEVYETGHVRWVGYAFVSRMKETRSSIDPEDARDLIERWHALELHALPKTFGEAVSATDVVPRTVTHVDAAGRETQRWEGILFDDADVELFERRGISEAPLDQLQDLMSAAESVSGASALIKPPRCWNFDLFGGATRVGDSDAAETARRQFEKHPDWFHIRISIVDTPSMRRHATALLRALVEVGVPRERVRLEVLPVLPDTLLPELAHWGSGWVGVGTLRCLGEENE